MGILAQLFTWWNGQTIATRLFTARKGQRVGEDAEGNVYYQNAGGGRRWVIYNGAIEASRVAPEWHGQVPSGLKNLFLLCGKDQMGHKPALIVTVSSGDGGAYPVAELRMSSYKNNRLCYIPEQIIVRHVETVLNDDSAQNDPDPDAYFRDRIRYALGILREYALALRQVRASGVTDTGVYRNGM